MDASGPFFPPALKIPKPASFGPNFELGNHPRFLELDRDRAMELVWENSLRNRDKVRGEILLPFNVVQLIGEYNVEVLHARFRYAFLRPSSFQLTRFYRTLIGVEVFRFQDNQWGCVRLMPEFPPQKMQIPEWARRHISDQLYEAASQGMNLYPEMQKIPRPPNSFILYRQHYHRSVTASNPGIKNTEICESPRKLFHNLFHDFFNTNFLG